MNSFNATAYGPVFAPWLASDRRRPLAAGSPNHAVRAALQALTLESAFGHVTGVGQWRLADTGMAACCLAGVWLLHDFLAESHTISQAIDTTSGSFWHGIMHRREGDYSNAKYWFRRVGEHEAFKRLSAHLTAANVSDKVGVRFQVSGVGVLTPDTRRLTPALGWDPFAFVDNCQAAVRGNPASRDRCLDLQQLEWETLFDYCYCAAVVEANG